MSERGSGSTTKQILNLPIGGYFVVAGHSMRVAAKRRASDLGRDDVKVLTVEECRDGEAFSSLRAFSFDVDHDTTDYLSRQGDMAALRRWSRTESLMRDLASVHEHA